MSVKAGQAQYAAEGASVLRQRMDYRHRTRTAHRSSASSPGATQSLPPTLAKTFWIVGT